jgi:tetratricopeptide (TPR) repeat protein
MVAAFLAVVAAAPLGISAARRELSGGRPAPLRAFARASAGLLLLQAALVGGAAARTAFFTPCSLSYGIAFVPAVALPSALAAAALSTLAGFLARGRRLLSALLYLAGALASLGTTLLEGWLGPSSYLLDHLLGIWPGPIYDEALSLDRRLLLFRLGSLAWTVALLAVAQFVTERRRTPPGRARGAAIGVALALATVGAIRVVGAWTGDLATRASLHRVLGGRLTGPLCDLHYPREKPAADAERLFRACQADVAEVSAALGISTSLLVNVWIHRSEEEKRRLVGAGRTEFTKPWLGEIQVLDAASGPPALRHEIVHAVGGAVAGGPLGVPARAGILVDAGLVEGLAVALEVPRGEWTTHEWARAMKDLGLLPPAARLVEPAGFFSAPAARAYGASGSFLASLIETRGAAPVLRAYAGTPFAEAFGRSIAELEQDWHAFLDTIPVPPELAVAAEARFRPAGLLGRRCARETAGLEARAQAAARSGHGREAAALWRRAGRISGDPAYLRGAADALRLTDPSAAEAAYSEALAALGAGRPPLRSAILESQGDLRWRAGDESAAAARYREALALLPDRPRERLLTAKIAAVTDPALAAAAPWFLGKGDAQEALRSLSASENPIGPYLSGRAAAARGDSAAAIPLLERALAGSLPSTAFRVEALSSLAAARCATGDLAGARAAWWELERAADREADRERARHAASRCAVEPPPR